jgi:hypothetical protein
MRIGCVIGVASSVFMMALFIAGSAIAQGYGSQGFALGIHLGLASVQLSVNECDATKLALSDLREALSLEQRLNAGGYRASFIQLEQLLDRAPGDCGAPALSDVEAHRTGLSAEFGRSSKLLPMLYDLGVQLGIAEGQASRGEPARQVVSLTLRNAVTTAEPILGAQHAAVVGLQDCVKLADGTTPLSEVQSKLVAVRATIQAELGPPKSITKRDLSLRESRFAGRSTQPDRELWQGLSFRVA